MNLPKMYNSGLGVEVVGLMLHILSLLLIALVTFVSIPANYENGS